jgi:hypothetical protein
MYVYCIVSLWPLKNFLAAFHTKQIEVYRKKNQIIPEQTSAEMEETRSLTKTEVKLEMTCE